MNFRGIAPMILLVGVLIVASLLSQQAYAADIFLGSSLSREACQSLAASSGYSAYRNQSDSMLFGVSVNCYGVDDKPTPTPNYERAARSTNNKGTCAQRLLSLQLETDLSCAEFDCGIYTNIEISCAMNHLDIPGYTQQEFGRTGNFRAALSNCAR